MYLVCPIENACRLRPTQLANYNVVTPTMGGNVWRKHSDFVWLRDFLAKRYLGMFIPSIPAKLSGNASLALCEPRKRLLRHFLKRVAQESYLKEDTGLAAFLTTTDNAVSDLLTLPPPPPSSSRCRHHHHQSHHHFIIPLVSSCVIAFVPGMGEVHEGNRGHSTGGQQRCALGE